MLTNLNILVLGGDRRYLEVIKKLSTSNANVYVAGFDKQHFINENIKKIELTKFDSTKLHAILLPVSGTSNTGEVLATYSDRPLKLTKEFLNKTPKNCIIYTGITNPYLDDISKERTLIPIFKRDDIAIRNSIPTAEAALQLAIQHTDITIHHSEVCVLGFGRVGMTVARLFANVGANVTVAVRKSADIARIFEMGLHPIYFKNINEIAPKIDVFINTVPQMVVDSDLIQKMNLETLIIDVASEPGGTDFKAAEKRGIKALLALGLPGKTAPKSAGNIIAETLLPLLNDNHNL